MISSWTRPSAFAGPAQDTSTLPLLPAALAALSVLVYPTLVFSVRGGMNGLFAVLVLLSVYALARGKGSCRLWDRTAIAYALAMASLVLAIALNQVVHGYFVPGQYDGPSRFLFAVLIYLFVRRAPMSFLTPIQYGLCAGAIASALVLSWTPRDWGGDGRLGSYFLNPIHYGDLALITGALAFLSMDWNGRDPRLLRSLKWFALIAGLYASLLTGSRGGWLAAPALMAVWAHKHRRGLSRRYIALAFVGVGLAVWLIYALVGGVQSRIDLIHSNLIALQQGDADTSIGLRLQIWKAALLMIWQHPLFGVGFTGFGEKLISLGQNGVITSAAVQMGLAEVHNEILAATVKLGVIGFASMLSVYLVPLMLFMKAARSAAQVQSVAGILGVATVVAFMIFGLTVEIFNLKMTVTFYSLTVAVLLGVATHRHFDRRPAHAG